MRRLGFVMLSLYTLSASQVQILLVPLFESCRLANAIVLLSSVQVRNCQVHAVLGKSWRTGDAHWSIRLLAAKTFNTPGCLDWLQHMP